MKYWRGYLVAGIVAAITLGLQQLAKHFPQLLDMFYPYLTREVQSILSTWTGTVDFTVWQVLAMLIIVVLMATIVLMIVLKWNVFQWLGWLLSIASLVWLLHTGVWGLNYYSSPLTDDIRMDRYEFTVDDLADASLYFLTKANDLAHKLPRDDAGDLDLGTFQEVAEKAGQGFRTLTFDTSPVFGGSIQPVKQLSWADLYTSMGITGVTFPLTGEAAVNPQIPAASLPFTICHEMAHRMCIAVEHDANFAAFLACIASEDPAYQYSGYYMAYRYCYSALMSDGSAAAVAAAARINLQASANLRHDLQTYDAFFAANKNAHLTNAAETANDVFIQISGDESGTASYSEVSILLVNWYIEEMVMPYIEQDDPNKFDPMDKDYIGSILEGIG